MLMSDPDGMKRGFDLSPPVIEEVMKCRIARRDILLLERKLLQQARMVGHEIMHFDQRQAEASQLSLEVRCDQSLGHFHSPYAYTGTAD